MIYAVQTIWHVKEIVQFMSGYVQEIVKESMPYTYQEWLPPTHLS